MYMFITIFYQYCGTHTRFPARNSSNLKCNMGLHEHGGAYRPPCCCQWFYLPVQIVRVCYLLSCGYRGRQQLAERNQHTGSPSHPFVTTTGADWQSPLLHLNNHPYNICKNPPPLPIHLLYSGQSNCSHQPTAVALVVTTLLFVVVVVVLLQLLILWCEWVSRQPTGMPWFIHSPSVHPNRPADSHGRFGKMFHLSMPDNITFLTVVYTI